MTKDQFDAALENAKADLRKNFRATHPERDSAEFILDKLESFGIACVVQGFRSCQLAVLTESAAPPAPALLPLLPPVKSASPVP